VTPRSGGESGPSRFVPVFGFRSGRFLNSLRPVPGFSSGSISGMCLGRFSDSAPVCSWILLRNDARRSAGIRDSPRIPKNPVPFPFRRLQNRPRSPWPPEGVHSLGRRGPCRGRHDAHRRQQRLRAPRPEFVEGRPAAARQAERQLTPAHRAWGALHEARRLEAVAQAVRRRRSRRPPVRFCDEAGTAGPCRAGPGRGRADGSVPCRSTPGGPHGQADRAPPPAAPRRGREPVSSRAS
jgi:hypothetical protein